MARRKSIYRTSAGQTVDFGAMLAQNETVPALGNMNVNARGDEIASDGTIIKTRDEIQKEYNKLNTMVPSDDAIPEGAGVNAIEEDDWKDWEPPVTTQSDTKAETRSYIVPPQEEQPTEQAQPKKQSVAQMVEANPDKVIDKTTQAQTPVGGFAKVVAERKVVTDTNIKTQEQEIKDNEGVKRL